MNTEVKQLHSHGFVMVRGLLTSAETEELRSRVGAEGVQKPGTRGLLARSWCAGLVRALRARSRKLGLMRDESVAVQCMYFEKSTDKNWLVPIHQDLAIPVAERVPSSELKCWSVKEGSTFVQPPVSVLEELVALRVHLDPCSADDGPLRVVPGSHNRGLVSPEAAVLARQSEVACLAREGDVLFMRPLLLHSSSKAAGASSRRVLHVLFGPKALPYGLAWPNAA
jgi:Phytanoyl-CoA dioxygenase (PhyH)